MDERALSRGELRYLTGDQFTNDLTDERLPDRFRSENPECGFNSTGLFKSGTDCTIMTRSKTHQLRMVAARDLDGTHNVDLSKDGFASGRCTRRR